MDLFKLGANFVAAKSKEVMNVERGGREIFDVFQNPPSIWPSFLVGQHSRPVRTAIVDADSHF